MFQDTSTYKFLEGEGGKVWAAFGVMGDKEYETRDFIFCRPARRPHEWCGALLLLFAVPGELLLQQPVIPALGRSVGLLPISLPRVVRLAWWLCLRCKLWGNQGTRHAHGATRAQTDLLAWEIANNVNRAPPLGFESQNHSFTQTVPPPDIDAYRPKHTDNPTPPHTST